MQQALQLGLLDPVTAAAVAGSTSANAGGDNVIQVHHDGRSGDSSSTSSIDSSCSSHGARPAEHCATAAADQLLPSNTSAGQPCVQQLQQQVCAQAADVFSNIFAVGDNPAADIRGANNAGHPWVSVLVRTGVFQGEGNSEVDPAHIVVTDVLAAVQAGLHRARSSRWHSMR
jgi:phosphoglycolate phosphatase-like HAD superfamily hydrolase